MTAGDPPPAIPAGYEVNSEGDQARLAAVMEKVWKEIEGTAAAVAVVVVLPDNKVTTALAASSLDSMARLMSLGPENLRLTIDRMIAGFGKATVLVKP